MKITEEMKRTARQADIVALCQLMGETLFIENEAKGEYRIKGANGLLIWKNCYYWFGSPTGDGRLEGQPPNTSNNTLSFAMYYYGMSAQLKTVVDRFCSYNSSLNSRHLKSALLAVAWNSDDWTFDALEAHYKALVRYINFEDMGMVLGTGCGTPSMTRRSKYPDEAYKLGRSL